MAAVGKNVLDADDEAGKFSSIAAADLLVDQRSTLQCFIPINRKKNIEMLFLLNVIKVKFYPLNAGEVTLPQAIVDLAEALGGLQRLFAVFDLACFLGRTFDVLLHIRHRVFELTNTFP